jgi:THO complex subunit 4
MSARLDKSLDEIISTQRRSAVRGGRGRRVRRTTQTAPAPVGGVKKTTKQAKGAVKPIPTGPSGAGGEGKILVTGFVSIIATLQKSFMLTLDQPKDITEPMIKVCYR